MATLLIFFVNLPYHIFVIAIYAALAAPFALIGTVVLYIPAILVNTKRMVNTLKYWTGSHRYKMSRRAREYREGKTYQVADD